MIKYRVVSVLFTLALAIAAPAFLNAEVSRVEIATRTDVANSSYEQLVGRIYFSVDPANARNKVVARSIKIQLPTSCLIRDIPSWNPVRMALVPPMLWAVSTIR